MSSFKVFTSNRLEILAKALSEVLKNPLPSPFDQEIIVVQSRGMQRWVSTELARYHGICANVHFPFPNTFVDEVFASFLHLPSQDPGFTPEVMTWKIMSLLPSLTNRPEFKTLKYYLSGQGTQVKMFQLAERIAHTFDQYLTFRPEMIVRWEKGDEHHWQAVLWRELAGGYENGHRPAQAQAFFDALKEGTCEHTKVPSRISVFGISVLPRFHIDILAGVSQLTPVNLFLMNPCRKYWGDILSEWEVKRSIDRESVQDASVEDLYLEKGNSILASMGTMGRDFFDLLNELSCEDFTLFEDPTGSDMLSLMQSDILNLRGTETVGIGKRPVSENDESVRIHICHSAMREMEVLHDQLLHIFEQDSSLLPKDVLVMTPNIERYAPYIHTVFGMPEEEAHRFPYNLADRNIGAESHIMNTFFGVLDFCGSRFNASHVLAIMESPAVRARFDLSESDLELIRSWVSQTGIRWGIDAENRSDLGLPAFSENTWKSGLQRLLLGYAMPGEEQYVFENIVPYDSVEGEQTLVLGRFVAFAERLFTLVPSLDQARTLSQWTQVLNRLIDSLFFADEDAEHELQLLQKAVNSLDILEKRCSFVDKVDIRVIKKYLHGRLGKEGVDRGFMTNGITFCSMLPMRSIPFKVICLVGMNSDAYPRQSSHLGFDLIAQHPRPGDRSRRDDDRYLFLEALLSARKKLHISYVGLNARDNSAIAPCVLVSELMDYIEQCFDVAGRRMRDFIVTRHRLQAFSPVYFSGGKNLFSYSKKNKDAAQALVGKRQKRIPFISKAICSPQDAWKGIDLGDLCGFFKNPTKFLMNKRFGIFLEEPGRILEDSEHFHMKGLERYIFARKLVERLLSGEPPVKYLKFAMAAGQLPHGTVGVCLYEKLSSHVRRFVQHSEPYVKQARQESLMVDLPLSGFRITGKLDGVGPERLVQYRFAKVKCKDRISLWIRHLVLNCLQGDYGCRTSMLIGLPDQSGKSDWEAWEFGPVENSESQLQNLVQIYWEGLCRPVHFFPESSWTYVHHFVGKKKSGDDALASAHKSWLGNEYVHGESEDPYYQCCFEDAEALDAEFKTLSIKALEPLVASQKAVKK